MKEYTCPASGIIKEKSGLVSLTECSDGYSKVGIDGVSSITSTGDGKVEFIATDSHVKAYIKSSLGYPAYYPMHEVDLMKPVKAVLMDLDGTTVRSEEFWMWIIQLTVCSLLGNQKFELEDSDKPFVSGNSVSEHLQYSINKYCPGRSVEEARDYYFDHTRIEMKKIVNGNGRNNAFAPVPGIKEFLLELKNMNVKIGLVSSGLYEKAWPEILSAFRELGMGDPKDFYDSIITAGCQPGHGRAGTMGELEPKPHPWLYAEAARIGLGIPFSDRKHVIGIEDSGAGICSVRLAGFSAIGITGGNIIESGSFDLCNYYCDSFEEILTIINE
jgi:beta-phosphoglucomutase-like phosphatase (HAD superfamily)